MRERSPLSVRGIAVSLGLLLALACLAVGARAANAASVNVTDATLAWGISDQTNARSHNPLAINFISAGIADPGRGGAELPESKWAATTGDVAVQKRDAAGLWQPATWRGLGTDANGVRIGMTGPFSGHRVVLSAGTGSVDSATDDATLAWRGTFSVVYYGGNSVFTVTDPSLTLVGGTGSLDATVAGWTSERDDPTAWTPVPGERLSIATLSGVDVTDAGALAVPAYRGVPAAGSVPQATGGPDWGAFPAPMVAYLAKLGIDQFWYSTGLSSDSTKVAAPIAIGFAGGTPLDTATSPPPAPTSSPTNPVRTPPASAEPAPTTAPPTPSPSPTATPPAPASLPTAQQPLGPSPLNPIDTASDRVTSAGSPVVQGGDQPVGTQQLTLASSPARPPGSPLNTRPWWVGGALLLAAALLLLVPPRRSAVRASSPPGDQQVPNTDRTDG